jgi:hypothetical protein
MARAEGQAAVPSIAAVHSTPRTTVAMGDCHANKGVNHKKESDGKSKSVACKTLCSLMLFGAAPQKDPQVSFIQPELALSSLSSTWDSSVDPPRPRILEQFFWTIQN